MRTNIFLLIATLVFAMGCGVTYRGRTTARGQVVVTAFVPQRVVVTARPPAVQAAVTVRPTAPSHEAIWVDAYWSWEGSWTWVPGHWEAGRRGYVWVAPVANDEGGSVVYNPGYWSPEDRAPDPRDPLLEHGLVDLIVPRNEMRATLARLLRLLLPSEG